MSKSKLVCPFYSTTVERDMHGAQRKLNKESSLQLLQHFFYTFTVGCEKHMARSYLIVFHYVNHAATINNVGDNLIVELFVIRN